MNELLVALGLMSLFAALVFLRHQYNKNKKKLQAQAAAKSKAIWGTDPENFKEILCRRLRDGKRIQGGTSEIFDIDDSSCSMSEYFEYLMCGLSWPCIGDVAYMSSDFLSGRKYIRLRFNFPSDGNGGGFVTRGIYIWDNGEDREHLRLNELYDIIKANAGVEQSEYEEPIESIVNRAKGAKEVVEDPYVKYGYAWGK